MNKTDKFIDKIYENRGLFLRYFAVVIICSILRYALGVLLSVVGFAQGDDTFVAWCLWAVVLYPLLKIFVFKYRAPHIFALLTQIMYYILCIGGLWFARSLVISLLYVLTSNTVIAMSLGGFFAELLCMILMFRVVFRNIK